MKCPICKFAYVSEIEENVRQHDVYHDHFLNGIEIRNIEEYQNFKINDNLTIIIINQLIQNEKRKIAEDLAKFPMDETIYSGLPYSASEPIDERDVHAILLVKDFRAIGLLVIEKRSEIWLTSWEDFYKGQVTRLKEHKPIWSISMIWIANSHRRQGYCILLVKKALSHFKTDLKNIGWYTPFTKDGEMFVKSICPNEFYIAQ